MAGRPLPIKVFDNNNAVIDDGALIYTYITGTSTPKTSYQDAAKNTAHANPVVCDSRGEALLYLDDDGVKYTLVAKDSTGTTTYFTWNDIVGLEDSAAEAGGITLAGTLDTNGNDIVSSSNQNIVLDPHGTGKIVAGAEITSENNENLTLTPNGSGELVLDGLKWPTADGTADFMITTDGAGQLEFTVQPSISDVNGMNHILGGHFSTNPWQRGTSFASVADDTVTADRYIYRKSGTVVHTVTKATDAPTTGANDSSTQHSLKLDCTTADGSLASSDMCSIQYHMEGYDFSHLAGKQFTLSFWVKDTKTGTHCVAFRNSGQDRSFVKEYTVTSSNTWEQIEVTIDASPSAGTWDYTGGSGLIIDFMLSAGSNFQGTGGSWQSGDILATSSIVNSCDSSSNNFLLANIKLEIGTSATNFLMRPYRHELELCQRYFQKTFPQGTAPAQAAGNSGALITCNGTGTNTYTFQWDLKTSMRPTPSVTTYSVASANATIRNITSSADTEAPTSSQASTDRITFWGDYAETDEQVLMLQASADAEFSAT